MAVWPDFFRQFFPNRSGSCLLDPPDVIGREPPYYMPVESLGAAELLSLHKGNGIVHTSHGIPNRPPFRETGGSGPGMRRSRHPDLKSEPSQQNQAAARLGDAIVGNLQYVPTTDVPSIGQTDDKIVE
jgi:hypothetical protein